MILKNSFFPSAVIEWNNFERLTKISENQKVLISFKKSILKFIRPSQNRVYNCHNPKGIKLLTRLRVDLSHLREHKFKHSFQDTLNTICKCGKDIQISSHHPLEYSHLYCSQYF